MPIRKEDAKDFYICLECGTVRAWNDHLYCRVCGGKIVGPVDKSTADAAASDPRIKQRIISDINQVK
jgi:rRNA maturation endonuclease Nob1